ncbi:MAG: AhpC/TSA family protein [Novosphingobium sp.]|nr:AhpC/TSA family protein [Novosphingobium sp.]
MPREPFPDLDLPTADGGRFVLSECQPAALTMLVFYRGYHCPICRTQLAELQDSQQRFNELGVEAVAISMDGEERARKAQEEWGLGELRIGYGLSEADARAAGLYISGAISDKEPPRFSEPGLFLINPDGTLYGASIQTMPFTRPPFAQLLQVLGYVTEHGYPPRGEVGA